MNFKKMWRKGLLLAVLAMALLTVCAAAEENGQLEEEISDLPVRMEYDPLGQDFSEGLSLQYVESIPFSGTTYGESLKAHYPDAYTIYKEIDSFMSHIIETNNTTWMAYRDADTTIKYMLGYKITYPNTDIADKDDAARIAIAAYSNDHPLETSVLGNGFLPGNGYIGLEVFDIINGPISSSIANNEIKAEVDNDIKDRLRALKGAAETFETKYQRDSMDSVSVGDSDRYRYIHDYLCNKLYYNDDAASSSASSAPEHINAHNAFGALIGLGFRNNELFGRGNVVCQGYADAFLLLCQQVGLPCTVVIGAGSGSSTESDHMWNAVQLDGNWYCLDVTWDDIDETSTTSNSAVDYSTMRYQYFLNNDYFVGGSKDHNILGQSNCGGESFLQAPDIKAGQYGTGDLVPEEITFWLYPAGGKDTANLSDALEIVERYSLGSFRYSSIPVVNIILTSDATVSSACYVPADREYWVMSNDDSTQYELVRGDTFTGPMFYVEKNGELLLFDLDLLGNESAAAPLVMAETAEYIEETDTLNRAEIYLSDVSVTGNNGACGMDVDAYLNIGGKCVIDQNYIGEKPQNLKLGTYSYICVGGTLEEGSVISVTAPENDYFAGPSKAGWTESDRVAFQLDESDKTLVYEPEGDRLYCCAMLSTDAGMPVSISYTYIPSMSVISSGSVALSNQTNNDQTITLYAAMYSEKGKLLEVRQLGHVTLTAKTASDPIALPEAVNGTLVYKVFAVGSNHEPIAENVVYDFSTGGL